MLKLRLFFKSKAMNTLRLFIIRHLSVYYMLIACFAFSLMGAASKLLSEQVSSVEIVLFRNIIGLAFILAALYRHRNFGKGGAPWLFVFRGAIGSLGLLCFFYNIAHIELGTAFTFQKTAPIFIAVFSYFALKEKLSKLGWVAILLGFIGIVFIMKPSGDMELIDSIIGLSGGVCMGLAMTSVRKMRKYYSADMIILSFMIFGTIPMTIILAHGEYTQSLPAFVMPDTFGLLLALGVGLLGYIYQVYMTKSYRATRKAGIPAAVSYADIVFSMILGVLLGDALPMGFALLGIVVIIFSGLLIAKEK